jgi:fibrillarin-like rRNA methylase
MKTFSIQVTTNSGTILTWDDHIQAETHLDAIKQACIKNPYSHDHVKYMEAIDDPKQFRYIWGKEPSFK